MMKIALIMIKILLKVIMIGQKIILIWINSILIRITKTGAFNKVKKIWNPLTSKDSKQQQESMQFWGRWKGQSKSKSKDILKRGWNRWIIGYWLWFLYFYRRGIILLKKDFPKCEKSFRIIKEEKFSIC